MFACRTLGRDIAIQVLYPTGTCAKADPDDTAEYTTSAECVRQVGDPATPRGVWTPLEAMGHPARCAEYGGVWNGDRDVCQAEFRECEEYVNVGFVAADSIYPSREHGAELYAWGFSAVIAPALILWAAVVVVRGIRKFFDPSEGSMR